MARKRSPHFEIVPLTVVPDGSKLWACERGTPMAKDVLLLLYEVLDALAEGSEAAIKLGRPDKASEAHHPRLFLRQFQAEFPESIRQVLVEPFRIAPVLEVRHEIVSKPGQVRLSLTARSDLLLEPEIKNEMQVDIG